MRNFVIAAGAAALAASLYLLATSLWVRPERAASPSHLNAEYVIGAARVRLVDGLAETPAAQGSAAKILTRYVGNELRKAHRKPNSLPICETRGATAPPRAASSC